MGEKIYFKYFGAWSHGLLESMEKMLMGFGAESYLIVYLWCL